MWRHHCCQWLVKSFLDAACVENKLLLTWWLAPRCLQVQISVIAVVMLNGAMGVRGRQCLRMALFARLMLAGLVPRIVARGLGIVLVTLPEDANPRILIPHACSHMCWETRRS